MGVRDSQSASLTARDGQVAVPDPLLAALAAKQNSAKIVNAQLSFVDVAGLVRGASQGKVAAAEPPERASSQTLPHDTQGMGNKFLSDLRAMDALVTLVSSGLACLG